MLEERVRYWVLASRQQQNSLVLPLCCAEEVDIISFPFKTYFRIFILQNHLTKGGVKYLFWKILGYSKLFN